MSHFGIGRRHGGEGEFQLDLEGLSQALISLWVQR